MSAHLRALECPACDGPHVAVNIRDELYLTCECTDSPVPAKVADVIPEEWR